MARAMLVDDEPDGLEMRRRILEHRGHQVMVATSRETALAQAIEAKGALDCVITDLRLPELRDGFQLIRDLRELMPAIRIIVLSGAAQELQRDAAGALVDAVVLKPARMEELLRVIESEGHTPQINAD